MSTKLRLLLDEQIPHQLAKRLERFRALNCVYVPELHLKGKDDTVLMEYARQENRILVTTDRGLDERAFPICTHPGIIILGFSCRHEPSAQRAFRKFLLSGARKHTKDSVTHLSDDSASIRGHGGAVSCKL